MTFDEGLTELNTILGDAADVTFSSSEKTRALTKAWRDSHIVREVWDTSLTYTVGTYQYSLPTTLTTIKDIYISPTGAQEPFPDPIDNDLWELVDDNIQFTWQADRIIPNGYTLYIKGNYKLTTTDAITNTTMIEYVLAIAGVETLKLLAHKKANLFTKNDVSMGELITLKRELNQDVVDLRRRLRRSWESA